MATWRDFVNFIDRTYKYEILNDGLLKLVFNTSNLRSHSGNKTKSVPYASFLVRGHDGWPGRFRLDSGCRSPV